MNARLSPVLSAACLLVASTAASAQILPDPIQLTQVSDITLPAGVLTEDLAITPNGNVGFVRCTDNAPLADQRFMAIDMTLGTQLAIVGHDDALHALGGFLGAADAVVCNNRFAVTVGSVEGPNPATFVDFYGILPTPAPPATVLHLGQDVVQEGRVNDLQITPDGLRAVVTCDGSVLVYQLGNVPVLLADISVAGSPAWTQGAIGGGTYDDQCVDSVEVTNDRAFVTVRSAIPGCPSLSSSRAYVIDLQANPPAILGEMQWFSPDVCATRWPHDVAILPDGNTGIQSGWNIWGRADLSTGVGTPEFGLGGAGTFTGGVPGFATLARRVCDSVEVDDSAAVFLQSRSASTGSAINLHQLGGGTVTSFQEVLNVLERPIDLATAVGRACVVTSQGVRVCSDLYSATPTWALTVGGMGMSSDTATGGFLSDAVVAHGGRAAVIRSGAVGAAAATGEILGVNLLTGAVTSTDPFQGDQSGDRLTDIALTPDGLYAFVRGSQSTATNGENFRGYRLTNMASLGTFSLPGNCNGLDHVEAAAGSVLTMSDTVVSVFNY